MRERDIMGLKVTNILTADTFEVFPPWRWEDQSGIKVKVASIEVPSEGEKGYEKAMMKLKIAVEGKEVELRNEKEVDYDRLVCDVYVYGKSVLEFL